MTEPSTARAPRRASRAVSGRVVAGVARGLAEHLGLPTWLVRLAFVVLAVSGGVGIVLYAALWVTVPQAEGAASEPKAGRSHGTDGVRLVALAVVALGVVLLLSALGADLLGGVVPPLVIALAGAALVWQQADDGQRSQWTDRAGRAARDTAASTAEAGRWRIVVGVVLVGLGGLALLVGRSGPAAAGQALLTALVLIAGVGLVAFPWGYRRYAEQTEQRRSLIREQERAEIAAHVHDSVLQTLTLIQRNADDADQVMRLARTEERALRSWLYTPTGDADRSLAAALQREAVAVESAYGATIDVVTVGDATIGAPLAALVAASREAMVNAARHGGGSVSVYAEVDEGAVEVFVRDRGEGFRLDEVPADRRGVSESIVGRMTRNGGTAEVVTAPGAGTQVRLRLPRDNP